MPWRRSPAELRHVVGGARRHLMMRASDSPADSWRPPAFPSSPAEVPAGSVQATPGSPSLSTARVCRERRERAINGAYRSERDDECQEHRHRRGMPSTSVERHAAFRDRRRLTTFDTSARLRLIERALKSLSNATTLFSVRSAWFLRLRRFVPSAQSDCASA